MWYTLSRVIDVSANTTSLSSEWLHLMPLLKNLQWELGHEISDIQTIILQKLDEWGLFGTSVAFDQLTDALSCVTGALTALLSAHHCDKQNTLDLSKYCNHIW